MSPELKIFLVELRQHPHFPQLLAAMERPRMPEYRPSKGEALDIVGANHAYASGQLNQYRQWLTLLTGEANPSETGDRLDR